MRHGARHTFDKLKNRPEYPNVLKRFLLQQAVYWAVRNYFEVRDIPYYGDKQAFDFLRDNDPVLLENIDRFYATTVITGQSELADIIPEQVLAPVGGMWQDDEVLVFGDQGHPIPGALGDVTDRGAEVGVAAGSDDLLDEPHLPHQLLLVDGGQVRLESGPDCGQRHQHEQRDERREAEKESVMNA